MAEAHVSVNEAIHDPFSHCDTEEARVEQLWTQAYGMTNTSLISATTSNASSISVFTLIMQLIEPVQVQWLGRWADIWTVDGGHMLPSVDSVQEEGLTAVQLR